MDGVQIQFLLFHSNRIRRKVKILSRGLDFYSQWQIKKDIKNETRFTLLVFFFFQFFTNLIFINESQLKHAASPENCKYYRRNVLTTYLNLAHFIQSRLNCDIKWALMNHIRIILVYCYEKKRETQYSRKYLQLRNLKPQILDRGHISENRG